MRTSSDRVGPDPARLADFARRITEARNPMLVLGASVERTGGWDAGLRLAETLNVPVWVPPETERAAFPEDHPLFQGFLPFDSLLADPRLAIEGLLQQIGHGRYPEPPRREQSARPASSSGELTPSEVFATVEDNRPDDAVFVLESTSNIALFHEQVAITRPGSFDLFGSGGLGWGLPAAVGHALAERDSGRNRPVLAVLGDGAANYSIQALYTAAQRQLPVVFLVLANHEYAILKAFADQQDTPGVPGMDLPGLDFVALATGYGCAAARVATSGDLAAQLQVASSRSGPTVLEVSITADVPPLM